MFQIQKLILAGALALSAFNVCAETARAASEYKAVVIPTFGYGGEALFVSEAGDILGYANFIDSPQAFRWSNRKGTTLLFGAEHFHPFGANSSKVIVGSITSRVHAGIYSPTFGLLDVGFDPQNQSGLYSINEKGVAVGFTYMADKSVRAVIWRRRSGITSMPPLPGYVGDPSGQYSTAYSINNNGLVTGVSTDNEGYRRPVIWRDGGIPQILTTKDGEALYGYAFSSNDRGDVVGVRMEKLSGFASALYLNRYGMQLPIDASGLNQDYIWDAGLYDINNAGTAVGYAAGEAGYTPILIPSSGKAAVLPVPFGLSTRGYARSINDRGEIAGCLEYPNKDGYSVCHPVVWLPLLKKHN
jgi:hypothetical protein